LGEGRLMIKIHEAFALSFPDGEVEAMQAAQQIEKSPELEG
jgi:hypothetical protein